MAHVYMYDHETFDNMKTVDTRTMVCMRTVACLFSKVGTKNDGNAINVYTFLEEGTFYGT